MQMSMDQMREALDQLIENLTSGPFDVQRGGIQYGPPFRPDARQGEEVYVCDLLPGARVYVLEDVFTVDRVDMDATPPTVWLKELPTSPLYFSEDESIYLAIETED